MGPHLPRDKERNIADIVTPDKSGNPMQRSWKQCAQAALKFIRVTQVNSHNEAEHRQLVEIKLQCKSILSRVQGHHILHIRDV